MKKIKSYFVFWDFSHKRAKFLGKNWGLLLAVLLNIPFSTMAQQQKVTVQVANAEVQEVFRQIKEQTGLNFIYNEDQVNQISPVTLNMKDTSIDAVLTRLFTNTSFEISYEKSSIVVRNRTTPPPSGQEVVIRGTILDEEGISIPGVSILLRGTRLGTASDADGKFSITLPSLNNVVLVFTCIGMKQREVPITDTQELKIVMEEESEEMQEVVVTGIYSRKAESFTGSAQTYTNKDLKMVGTMNVLQSLKTLDPSFAIIESDLYGSDPNRMPEININGKSTINALHSEYDKDPNAPLFILDGFETTLETINDLSMDRIQSITLLKDAASTAIYGAKAANGVVVVETKAPTAGRLRVNYNGTFQLAWADLTDYNLMNAEEKLEFEKLSGHYGTFDEAGFFDNISESEKYYSRLAEVRRGVDTYWMNEPLRTALTHGHTLFLEGGDNIFRYSLGLSYRNTAGVMKGSDRDALNGNVRMIYRHKNLAFTNYANIDLGNAISENANFMEFARTNPYYRKYNEFGQMNKVLEAFPRGLSGEFDYVYSPLYDMQQNSLNRTKTFTFTDNFNLEWKILSELQLRGRFSVSKSISKTLNFQSPNLSVFVPTELTQRGSYTENNAETVTYDGDITLTYGKIFKEVHLLNAVIGMNFRSNSSTTSGYNVRGFLTDRFDNPAFSNGFTQGSRPSYSESMNRSASYYFNGGYSYDNRYLVDFNFRMDGTSVFGVNNKFTQTWAVGFGWNLHREAFLKDNAFINYLKLRFSVGNPGNQNMEARMANNTYRYSTAYPNVFGLAATVSRWGNKDLDWQKTLNTNYGLDMEILNRRLRLTVEYYIKKTDPQIVSIDLPPSTGSSSVPSNLGGLKSTGLTLSANLYLMRTENLSWSINANLRHNQSKYYDIGNALEKYEIADKSVSNRLMRFYDGASTTALYAVVSKGIDPSTGREIFLKKNGTTTYIYDGNDEVKVGDSTPKVEGVVGTSFYYKGLSCHINFRYRTGGQIFLSTLYDKVENISEEGLRQNQDKRALYDRWKKPGDQAKFKAISLTDSTPMSSRFVQDENTFSCESITINYETQADWLKYAGITSLTFSASTNDIFRISTVKNERGLEFPFQRSVNFSVGLRF